MKSRRITDGICPLKLIPRSQRTRHGMTGTPEHRAWINMLERCHNPANPGFKNYGGRGISVCESWQTSFDAFFRNAGRRPGDGYSIDRIDNSRGYEPGNVRWAQRAEQQHNLRKNVTLTFNGETLCVREWSRRTGIDHKVISRRIRAGLPPESVLSKNRFVRGWRKTDSQIAEVTS